MKSEIDKALERDPNAVNTGNRNTGCRNTGNWNTGNWNTGNRNTGCRNTGDWNTGNRNTGCRNTGNRNTGDWNTGNRNTGCGNATNNSTGFFCTDEPTVLSFDVETNLTRSEYMATYPEHRDLCLDLSFDEEIDFERYKRLPGITPDKLKALHDAHKAGRNQ